jgi:hypothetical protein
LCNAWTLSQKVWKKSFSNINPVSWFLDTVHAMGGGKSALQHFTLLQETFHNFQLWTPTFENCILKLLVQNLSIFLFNNITF